MRGHFLKPLGFLAAFYFCMPARADTASQIRYSFFRSDVTVLQDATLEIREDFVVRGTAPSHNYAFRRDLPITRLDRWDPRYCQTAKEDNGLRADVREVTVDGLPVKYELGGGNVYQQLLFGGRAAVTDSAEHRVVIRYRLDSALSVGSPRDALFWNATGDELKSPVGEAFLAIHLPAGVSSDSVQAEPRVGGRGFSYPRRPNNILEQIPDTSGAIVYRATNLGPGQSLTLVVSWPSGVIHPSKFAFLRRNGLILAAPPLLFVFYLVAWLLIGPEPKPGILVTRYEPPAGISPAAARYLTAGTTDGRSFAAVIAQLAVRGCLRVEPANGKYKLSRLMSDHATEASLAPEEKRTLQVLFEDGPIIELSPAMDQRNAAKNGRYLFHIHDELTKQLGNRYFTRHSGILALGVLATIFSALINSLIAGGRDAFLACFLSIWILFCGLILGLLIEVSFASACKTAVRAGMGWVKLIPAMAALTVFGAIITMLLKKLADDISISFALILVAFLAINLGWFPWFKRKTQLGREVSDQIAGFRQFLQKVEQGPMNQSNQTGTTPEELDRYLPYAIALEVKDSWGDHLSQTFLATTVYAE